MNTRLITHLIGLGLVGLGGQGLAVAMADGTVGTETFAQLQKQTGELIIDVLHGLGIEYAESTDQIYKAWSEKATIAFELNQQNAATMTPLIATAVGCAIVFDPKTKKPFVVMNARKVLPAELKDKGFQVLDETASKVALEAMAKGDKVNFGVPEGLDGLSTADIIVYSRAEFSELSAEVQLGLCAFNEIFVTAGGDTVAVAKKSALVDRLEMENLNKVTQEIGLLAEKGIRVGILENARDIAEMLRVLKDDIALIYFDRGAEFKKMKAIIDSEVASGASHPVDFLVNGEQDGVTTCILLPRKNSFIIGGDLKSLGYEAFEG